MFRLISPRYRQASLAVAFGFATLATGHAQAQLTQVEYYLPALDAQEQPIDDCELKLTMQFDPNHQPAAGFKSLMFVHGGHWVGGEPLDKDEVPLLNPVTAELTRRGFVVYSPSYRLIKADHATPNPDQAACGNVSRADQHRDVQQGFLASLLLSHYQAKAAVDVDYGILLVGHSAGGHLVTQAGMRLPEDLRRWVRGVIPIAGPLSFERVWREENGLAPDPFAARDVELGPYTVRFAPVDAEARTAVLRTMDTYLAEGNGTKGAFAALSRHDPFLAENTFARILDRHDTARPPFYFLTGANDSLVPGDGAVESCRAIGAIHDVDQVSRGFWFWHQTHTMGACGDGDDRIHVVTPADHGMNYIQTFWRDALGWADALPFSAPE